MCIHCNNTQQIAHVCASTAPMHNKFFENITNLWCMIKVCSYHIEKCSFYAAHVCHDLLPFIVTTLFLFNPMSKLLEDAFFLGQQFLIFLYLFYPYNVAHGEESLFVEVSAQNLHFYLNLNLESLLLFLIVAQNQNCFHNFQMFPKTPVYSIHYDQY